MSTTRSCQAASTWASITVRFAAGLACRSSAVPRMFRMHAGTRRRSCARVNCCALSARAASESSRSPAAISQSRTRCLTRTRSRKPRSRRRICNANEAPSTAITSRDATSQVASRPLEHDETPPRTASGRVGPSSDGAAAGNSEPWPMTEGAATSPGGSGCRRGWRNYVEPCSTDSPGDVERASTLSRPTMLRCGWRCRRSRPTRAVRTRVDPPAACPMRRSHRGSSAEALRARSGCRAGCHQRSSVSVRASPFPSPGPAGGYEGAR